MAKKLKQKLEKYISDSIHFFNRQTFELKCPDPDCPGVLVLKESQFGRFYGCTNFPRCRNKHQAHKDGRPVGTPADAETRALRQQMHALANTIWKYSDFYEREAMYQWLAANTRRGHIGMMNKVELEDLKSKLEKLLLEKK